MFDALVVGGGPAGTAIAYRLGSLGYRVAMIAAEARAFSRLEILAPSAAHLQTALPLARAMATGRPATETRLLWSGAAETMPAARGTCLIGRESFDAALRAASLVPIIGARARAPYRAQGRWHVPLAAGGGSLTARFLIDASGRAGGVFGKAPAAGPATAALVGRWRGACLPAGTMLVEACASAWCWAAAADDGALQTAVFVDSADCAGKGATALSVQAERTLRACSLFAPALRGATLLASSIADATPRLADQAAGADWLRAGDAAAAPDPLSSQGITSALRAGVQGAAVVHTILSGGDREAALGFYAEAVRSASARHRREAAALYTAHGQRAGNGFWQARAASEPGAGLAKIPVRLAADARLGLSPDAVLSLAPALVGDRIERVPTVRDPSDGSPVAWIAGVPVQPLLSPFAQPIGQDELRSAWSRLMPPAAVGEVASMLVARGILTASKNVLF